MNYKVLYRKYRPQDFDTVIGQTYTTDLLKNAIIENKISHAYIFTGPRGTGKTSTARIFAKAINCTNLKDGNPCNECDNCKNFNDNPDLINNVKLAPSNLKYKVYIIDEFHMLSTSAFNALLLTLEEPPSNVVFILATTDIQNVPVTVLSRCQRYDFKLITFNDILNRLSYISKQEKIDIAPDALNEIAYLSSGGLRDALSILDQISTHNGTIEAEDITNMFGSVSTSKINQLIGLIEGNDAFELIEMVNDFKSNGVNFNVFVNKLISCLKDILINIKCDRYDGGLLFDDIYNLILDLNHCLLDSKNSIDPYSFVEILLLKYIKAENNNKKDNENQDIQDDYFPGNNSSENKCVIENNDEAIVNKKQMSEKKIEIRINNCFVNAKKEYLSSVKEKWNDFIAYESNANKKLLSYIIDTDIVAMSDSYGILMNKLDSTVALINENIESLENDFKLFYGSECRFIALSDKDWQKNKQDYINNLKNGIKYSIIDEKFAENDDDSNNSELEQLATEIFGDNVEIK